MPEEFQLQQLQSGIYALKGEIDGAKRGTAYSLITAVVPDTSAATAANYGVFFIAPYACEVIEAWESHKTAGSDGSAVTLTVEKLTGGQALDAGSAVLSGTWNLKGTANDPNRLRNVSSFSARHLNAGDRLALKDAGTLTAVAHVCVTILIKALNYNLSRVDNP
jgi:hypothetical protein